MAMPNLAESASLKFNVTHHQPLRFLHRLSTASPQVGDACMKAGGVIFKNDRDVKKREEIQAKSAALVSTVRAFENGCPTCGGEQIVTDTRSVIRTGFVPASFR
jgi:hypothetical protein